LVFGHFGKNDEPRFLYEYKMNIKRNSPLATLLIGLKCLAADIDGRKIKSVNKKIAFDINLRQKKNKVVF
jgi:hypothetical protein